MMERSVGQNESGLVWGMHICKIWNSALNHSLPISWKLTAAMLHFLP